MKSGHSRRGLLLAFLLASAAAVAAFMYLDKRDNSSTANPAPATTVTPTSQVLVAKIDLPANTAITLEMVEVQELAADQVQPYALSDSSQAVGMFTTKALLRGAQIQDDAVADAVTKPDSLAYKVPIGMRAISIVFDEVMGIGGLVQPGDHVDVIGYFVVELQAPQRKDTTGSPEPAFVVAAEGANLLEEPAKDADVLEDLDAETEVTVLGADGRYFQVDVGGTRGWIDANNIVVKDGTGEPRSDSLKYQKVSESHVATYIVQNVAVLAVSQAVSPEDAGVATGVTTSTIETASEGNATGTEANDTGSKPVARPGAKSVTLAVTPDQAQRLLLASQSTSDKQQERNIGLRLVVRAPGDTTIADLPPAEIGPLPIGNALSGVNQPLFPSELMITDVEITQLVVNAGEVLEFKATIKNVSDHVVRGATTAPPEFTYTQGTAYDTLGFTADINTYRIGLNFGNAYPTQFPYRWGIGRDLNPGETTTVVGSVQLTDPTPATTYWFGMIHEPEIVTQDGVGVSEITVLVPTTVSANRADVPLLDAADADAKIVTRLTTGQRLVVTAIHHGWLRVQADKHEGWLPFSAVDIPAPGAEPTSNSATRPIDTDRLNPWTQQESAR